MTRWPLTVRSILGVGLLVLAGPAFAGKDDDAWAACIWGQAPKSASNWLAMAPSKDKQFLDKTDRYKLLATRIEGFCRKAMIPSGKKFPPSFNDRKIRAALDRTRPSAVVADVGLSDAIRCEFHDGDVLLGISMFFGDPKSIKPRDPATTIKCERIKDDGTLEDA